MNYFWRLQRRLPEDDWPATRAQCTASYILSRTGEHNTRSDWTTGFHLQHHENCLQYDEVWWTGKLLKCYQIKKILPINLSKPARKRMLSDWWLVRVTLVAAFRFLGGGGDLWMIVLLLNECSLRSVDNQTWWGLLNPTCYFTTNLNFLHSQVAGTQKLRPQAFTPTPTPSEPSGGISTIWLFFLGWFNWFWKRFNPRVQQERERHSRLGLL